MKKHRRYDETNDFPGSTHLEISVYYSKGGVNYLTYKNEPRGFYLSVTPVKKDGVSISTVLGSGIKTLVLPVNRYSEKQHNIAIENSKCHEQELIDALKVDRRSA